MGTLTQRRASTAAVFAVFAAAPLLAQPTTVRQSLAAGSSFTRDGCLAPCECPYISPPPTGPLTGTFTLYFDHVNPLYTYYTVADIDLTAHLTQGDTRYTGAGTYQIGGEVAITQRLILDLAPIAQPGGATQHFDSGVVAVTPERQFPNLDITASTGNVGCFNRTMVIVSDGVAACAADLGSAGGVSGSDGELDNNDFIAFVDAFFNESPVADLGRSGGLTGGDGEFDNNDFVAFISLFFSGC